MLVQSIMTSPAITITPKASVAEAAKLMLENHISGLPVADEEGHVVGIVSESDFLRRGELDTARKRSWWLSLLVSSGKLADEYAHANGRRIDEVMSSPVTSVSPYTDVADAVEILEKKNIKRLPVVANGKIVGIVARSDFLRALSRTLPTNSVSQKDEQIETAIVQELAKQSWIRNGFIQVSVKDGIAELSGTIFDERERLAAKIAAENVAGVKSVSDQIAWVDPNLGVVVQPPGQV